MKYSNEHITDQEAELLLNIPNSFLIKLLESGEIAYAITGEHPLFSAVDILAYKERREASREAALQEIANLDIDHGLL